MAKESDLLAALEFVTEGKKTVLPKKITKPLFSTKSFQLEVESIKKKATPWTRGPGIQGMGLGERYTQGKQQKDLALRVYVEKKKPLSKVKNKVPENLTIPGLGVFHTDVIEIGKVQQESMTQKVRPAMPGSGLAHIKVSVGTFGCLVLKKQDPKSLYILSNSHVLADAGTARLGDKIIQPGRYDGGKAPTDIIAKLSDFKPFVFGKNGYPNFIDAAIAKVPASKVVMAIRIIGRAPTGVSKFLRRGMNVHKVGRTTDYTVGKITDINYRLYLKYKKPGGKSGFVGLKDQVLCTRYTAAGDSGAVVMNTRGKLIGLHFAGSQSASIFNRIEHVFRQLDLELL